MILPMTIRPRVMESPMAEPVLAIRFGVTNTRKKDITPMMRESQLMKPYVFGEGACVSIVVTSFIRECDRFIITYFGKKNRFIETGEPRWIN